MASSSMIRVCTLTTATLVFLIIIPLIATSQSLPQPGITNELSNNNLPKRPFTDRECLMCRFSVSLVKYALSTNRGADMVNNIANSFCTIAHIETPLVCSQVTKLFNHEVMKVLIYGLVTPEQVCGLLSNNTCGTFNNPMSDWEVNLNASLELNQEELAKMHKNQQMYPYQAKQQQQFRVIQISDTHVDLRYQENSPAVCDKPLCCRSNSKPANGSKALSGYWGTYAHCDVPLRTFESALKAINSTMKSASDIDYILWTGDIQPHDVWEQNQKSAIQTYDEIFAKIFEYLPNARIFPTLGNHEMVPVDSFSPSNLLSIARDDSPEWLYRKLDSFWSKWLPADTIATITKDGFYATPIKSGLKLVSLNTNFCNNKNFWLYINSTDPGDQLKWLIHELQISELTHEKVHIVGHIPPGVEDCLKVWSKNYNRIIRRFATTIAGQFFGHTHNGEFELFYDQNGQDFHDNPKSENWDPISVGLIGSSITTFIDLNPSFRIYTMDANSGFQAIDYETFYMNLTAANLLADKAQPEWISGGKFTQLMGVKDLSPSSLHDLMLKVVGEIKADELDIQRATSLSELINKAQARSNDSRVYKLYRVFNSYSDQFNRTTFDNTTSAQLREFVCRFFTGQAHDTTACNRFIYNNGARKIKRAIV